MTALATLRIPGGQQLPSRAKDEKAVSQTLILNPSTPDAWKKPPFQRPVQHTSDRVKEAAIAMQHEAAEDPDEAWCHITGTIQLGQHGGHEYLVDGQHRMAAFRLATGPSLEHGCVSVKQAIAEVSIRHYDTMGEMAKAFTLMNTALNPIKPDDIMRALATDNPLLKKIEVACPMIGYDRTGKSKETTLLSMSTAIRTWFGSGGLIPAAGPVAREAVKYLTDEQEGHIRDFFAATIEAGWVSPTFQPLWGSLNLGINMWLWRRTVLGQRLTLAHGARPGMSVPRGLYVKCMRAAAATPLYLSYLRGKSLRFQDRRPTYEQLKQVYHPVLVAGGIEEPRFPVATDWGSGAA